MTRLSKFLRCYATSKDHSTFKTRNHKITKRSTAPATKTSAVVLDKQSYFSYHDWLLHLQVSAMPGESKDTLIVGSNSNVVDQSIVGKNLMGEVSKMHAGGVQAGRMGKRCQCGRKHSGEASWE
ncbi:hypothetical protein L596_023141 [Steinernema carpocapsae]|uniref:Uncharacterized protein n=1 Tax=Steinernema carpocapsae TaxID=34508 RepID=A0A4U5MCS0_STECR|nr:hypothetical protein L596_023141 [Steinernema carpocapsae]